jgi:NADH-quinone oxidoreductase subunit M
MAGAVYQMLNHGVSTGMLFLLVGVIYERRHTRLISEFGGLAKVMPAYAAVFVIVTLSSVGLPTTNGFVGEFLILWGTFMSKALPHARYMAMFAATGVVLGAVYMLSVVLRVFFGALKNPRNRDLSDLTAREWLYLIPGIVLIFVMGLWPTPFLSRIEPSVELMRMDYLKKARAAEMLEAPVLDAPLFYLLPSDKQMAAIPARAQTPPQPRVLSPAEIQEKFNQASANKPKPPRPMNIGPRGKGAHPLAQGRQPVPQPPMVTIKPGQGDQGGAP